MGPEILFVIPYAVGFAAVATIIGMFAIWAVWAGLRRWGSRAMRQGLASFPIGLVASALLCITLPVGCAWALRPVPQPASNRTVAAFEVPLPTAAERTEFLAILNREAGAEGLIVDAESDVDLQRRIQVFPDNPVANAANIGRDAKDLGSIARISRFRDGDYWVISFSRGEEPALATRFRDRAMRKVLERWPTTMALPISRGGSIPHKKDLVATDRGYVIDATKTHLYACPKAPASHADSPANC